MSLLVLRGLVRRCVSTSSTPTTLAIQQWRAHDNGHVTMVKLVESQDNGKLEVVVQQTNKLQKTKEKIRTAVTEPGTYTKQLLSAFLPKDYPDSVHPGYLDYIKPQAAQAVFGSAAGVMSMQSLLYAVGLGAGAIPLAAALNWVIKDGLGQLGAIVFASRINNRFDSNPKFWRFRAGVGLDLCAFIELLTPLAATYFLPIAAVANVGKNLSWLASSASRAAIHRSFAKRQNLADLTAKTGSQMIASSLVGTAIGVAVSSWVGHSFETLVPVFLCFASASIYANYRACKAVNMDTLDPQRFDRIMLSLLNENRIPTPFDIGPEETFVGTYSGVFSSRIKLNPPLSSLDISMDNLRQLLNRYQNEKYILHVSAGKGREGEGEISIFMKEEATSEDVVKAWVQAAKTLHQADRSTSAVASVAVESAQQNDANHPSREQIGTFLSSLRDHGWYTENHFLEDNESRIRIIQN